MCAKSLNGRCELSKIALGLLVMVGAVLGRQGSEIISKRKGENYARTNP